MQVSSTTSGFSELDALLAQMGGGLRKQVLTRVLQRGAAPFLQRGREMSPVGPDEKKRKPKNRIRGSWKAVPYKPRGRAERVALYDVAAVLAGPTAPHAHLVENGHAIVVGSRPTTRKRRIFSAQKSRQVTLGHVPAHPFVRPAWDASAAAVAEETKNGARDAVEAAIRGIAARAEKGVLTAGDVRNLLEEP